MRRHSRWSEMRDDATAQGLNGPPHGPQGSQDAFPRTQGQSQRNREKSTRTGGTA